MKILLILVIIAAASVDCDENSKFESIDLEAIMKNDRLLQNHFNCIIDGKGCTPDAEIIRKQIPEFVETCCEKCSDKHKEMAGKITKYIIANKPELLKRFLEKFDPDKKYRQKCADKLEAGGIDLSGL